MATLPCFNYRETVMSLLKAGTLKLGPLGLPLRGTVAVSLIRLVLLLDSQLTNPES